MKTLYKISLALLVFGLLVPACIPASISRIGPPRSPRKNNCEIDVLKPGKVPDRPWVDIGAVFLENCQEYHVGLCRKWLTQKACELGGEIAYLPNPTPPKDSFNTVNYRVLVAVYAVDADRLSEVAGCAEPKPAASGTAASAGKNQERCLE